MKKLSLFLLFWVFPSIAATGERIGLYTGTFDPPHVGHVEAVQAAQKELKLDLIFVVPNVHMPHKPQASRYEDRRAMTRLAFEGLSGITVADPELEKIYPYRPSALLIRSLAQRYPQARLYWVFGSDSFRFIRSIPFTDLPENLVWAVVVRPGDGGESLPTRFMNKDVVLLKHVSREASSTAVRAAIKKGEPSPLIKDSVMTYIREKGLYLGSPKK